MSLDKLIKTVEKYEKGLPRAVEVSARTVMSKMVQRIFTKGLNSSNGKIGEYSTKPIYIQNDKAPRSNKGKGRNNTYFADGYKEFKNKMGLGTKVNFKVFGELQRDFAGGDIDNPKPTKLGALAFGVVLKKNINILKREGLEERFTKTFDATRAERVLFGKTLEFELRKLLP